MYGAPGQTWVILTVEPLRLQGSLFLGQSFFCRIFKIALLSRWSVVREAGCGGHEFPEGCGLSLIVSNFGKFAEQPARSAA
jgi:hypothetical protein